MPYLFTVAGLFILWMASIWTMEGWPVYVTAILFFAFAIFMIPVSLYMDYRSAMSFVKTQVVLHKDPKRRSEAYVNLAAKTAEHCGVPEYIANLAANAFISRIERMYYTSQPQKEIHGSH